MGDILPECLEVQFGWVYKYTHLQRNVSWSGHFPDGSDSFRLRLLRSGSFVLTCNDQPSLLDSGSMILLPPFPPRTTTITQVIETGESICIGFRVLLFGNIDITPQLLHGPSIWRPDPAAYEALDAMMRFLLDRSSPTSMSASFIRDGLLRAIIGICWEPLGMEHVTEGRHSLVPKWVGIALQEIRHNPGMTVTELEQLTGYSHTHLDRLFLQHVGTSPREYLQRYRYSLAKHLLRTTEMSISSIAEHLGFSSTTGFIRFFQRMGQMTPSEYRQTSDLPTEIPAS